jgi:hypothetical protein
MIVHEMQQIFPNFEGVLWILLRFHSSSIYFIKFGFGFGPFKSLPQNFGLFQNGSKFQNFGLGDGKI